jgi:hypothetical protein
MGCGHVRVAQQFINRDPGVRKADHTPGKSGLGEPRQGTHLSMLRTTHPHSLEGAFHLPARRGGRPASRSEPGGVGGLP